MVRMSLVLAASLLGAACGRTGFDEAPLDDGASETFGDPDAGTSISTSATSGTSASSGTSDTATGTSDTGTSGTSDTGTSETSTDTTATSGTSGTSSSTSTTETSTDTSTSGTSSSDTGPQLDAGIPEQCLPQNGDTDCDLCIKESCCDESIACVDDFGCLCMIVCLQQGGSFPECVFICGFDPQESPEFFDLLQCVFGNCPQQC